MTTELVRDTADIISALEYCRRTDALAIAKGANSHLVALPQGNQAIVEIALTQLHAVTRFEPDDFYITCQAGMRLTVLHEILREKKLTFPFLDPDCPGTVGGMVASGQIHNLRSWFNISRWVLALKVIMSDGREIKTGAVTYKSVAGYDIPKLFCGSFGTLGIIMEAALRCYPESGKPYGKDLNPTAQRSPILSHPENLPVPERKADLIARRIKHSFDPIGIFPAITGWNSGRE